MQSREPLPVTVYTPDSSLASPATMLAYRFPAFPTHYRSAPMQSTKTRPPGALNMLALAKHVEAKLFQAPTSELYGDPAVHPQREDYWGNVKPIRSSYRYDACKRLAETPFFDYRPQRELRIKMTRLFNTSGPRIHPKNDRVVANYIVQALGGEPTTLYADGTQTRSF